MPDMYAIKQESMSLTNVYRALVSYSSAFTGEIRVRIPALLGPDSEVSLSTWGRTPVNNVWQVPAVGSQIVVSADDANLTNLFWVQTDLSNGWATNQPINVQTGVVYIPSVSDVGKLVTLNNVSSIIIVTISTSLGLTAGQRIDFAQLGTGQVTFVENGTTVNATPGRKLRAQYSAATLVCLATDTYLLVGDLSA